jgi:LuxR family maltose regulon positive regulatory protein
VDQDGTGARRRAPSNDGSQLLRAKLRAPDQPEHFVPRPRLDRLLDDLVRAPLTLVVAPAGAGKSMLLAGWLATSATPGAWLSLDERDRDPAQLWSAVAASLDVLAPGTADGARAALRGRRPTMDVVGRLIDDLEGVSREPRVLVVDDLHLVDDVEEIAASLDLFLQNLPRWLHVVVLTRREPRLPVDRLRVRGRLGEIRFAELRFAPDEASELLARLAPSMSEADIEEAAEEVDGWAAGIQMAALSARSSQARVDAGTMRVGRAVLVDDFVWHEILAREPDDLVQLLLNVAVVDRVNAGLAEALSGRADAGDLLVEAESRGLFVSRLGVSGWFGVHSLVRNALLAELARRSPARLVEQHARAARWFEAEREVTAALHHWVLAERPRDALRLLAAEHAQLYDAGLESVVLRTIESIPASVTTADFDALLEYAWCHLLVSRRGLTDAVEHASWWAQQVELEPVQRGRLTMLEAIVQLVHADWERSAELARAALAQVGDRWRHDTITRFGFNLVARDLCLGERWDDRGEEARTIERAINQDPERRLSLEGTKAVGQALAGRPVDALQTVAGVRHAAAVSNMTILRAELSIAEAIAHRELGDRERALPELRALADMPAETMIYCSLLARLQLAEAHADVGAHGAALAALEEAERVVVKQSIGRGGRDWLARTGVTVSLASGDLEPAARWAGSIDDPFWSALCTARVRLARGDRTGALAAVEDVVPRCARHEVVLGLVRARAVEDPEVAAKLTGAALELAAASELLQTVASEGPGIAELLERQAWQVPPAWFDRLRRVVGATNPGAGGNRGLVDPLTDRERDVLRFLPSRLTTREIADELYVSVNTLKFHLKVIYRKLGVSSRAEAVEAARRLPSS